MLEMVLIISIVCNVLLAAGFVWKYREASRDHLTKLQNYKSFIRKFNQYTRYAVKKDIPFALLFIDIDHFKKINDAYSHLSGDLAIRAVGQRLQNEIKSTDLIARYGGEEFIICLKHCALREAETAANRILNVISNDPVTLDDQKIHLTVSIGVASSPETDTSNLIRAADQHMYEAKRRGRNQVYAGK